MRRILLASNLENPLEQFALEMLLALSERYPFSGKIETRQGKEEKCYRYHDAEEALGVLCNGDQLVRFTLNNESFSLLMEQTQEDIALGFVPSTPQGDRIFNEIWTLSRSLLAHMEAMTPSPIAPTIRTDGKAASRTEHRESKPSGYVWSGSLKQR